MPIGAGRLTIEDEDDFLAGAAGATGMMADSRV